MSWRALPPVGHPIALEVDGRAWASFPGYDAVLLNSGTAALALAMQLARDRLPHIKRPEVLLPAYGCPDLVAAASHAGIRPVLVDILANDPGYDLASLHSGLSADTVAVVAVNFLGIRERLSDVQQALSTSPAAWLIEDDAQWFPEPPMAAGLSGDVVCLSFGRGKPVSVLGGGALLVREHLSNPEVLDSSIAPGIDPGYSLAWQLRAYNRLLHPWLYGLVSHNPLLGVGRTALKPLDGIRTLDGRRARLLPANVHRHLQRRGDVAREIQRIVPPHMDLPTRVGARAGRLLRYPVLCEDGRQRDALWKALRKAGLGPSAMYQVPLPSIAGVPERVEVRGAIRGARQFADRLLTLPVHERVCNRSIERMAYCLRGVA